MVEPAAIVFHLRPADLALHAGPWDYRSSRRIVRSWWPVAALVFQRVVMADHVDNLVAGEGDGPG